MAFRSSVGGNMQVGDLVKMKRGDLGLGVIILSLPFGVWIEWSCGHSGISDPDKMEVISD